MIPEEIKRRALLDAGYDPEKYEADDLGYIKPKTPTQPSAGTQNIGQTLTIPSQKNVSSATTVALKSAASSIIPTAGALGGGALAAQALPLAHVFPPWSEIVAGLGGAVAGGYGASKLQEAVVPSSIQQDYFPTQEEIQAHPYAGIIGSTIPSLAAFNPTKSIQNLVQGGKVLGNRVAGGTATDAQMLALKALGVNTGINVGTGAGINIANQLQGDEPFSYGKLAAEAGLAGLLNQPRAPFQRFFGDSSIPDAPRGIVPPDRGQYVKALGPEQLGLESKPVTLRPEYDPNAYLQHPPEAIPTDTPTTIPSAPDDVIARLKAEGEATKNRLIAAQAEENKVNQQKLDDLLNRQQKRTIPVEGQITPEPPSLESQYQKSLNPSEELASKRGMRINPEIPAEGAGEYVHPNREIRVGAAGKRGGDTLAHETTHGYLLDLANSADPRDHRLLETGLAASGTKMTRQEYHDLNNRVIAAIEGRTPDAESLRAQLASVEEPLADAIGKLSYGRFTTNQRPLRQWGRDALNNLKVKLGTATPQQALERFTAGLHREAPYGSREAFLGDKSKSVGAEVPIRQQADTRSDREQYDDVQAKLHQMIKEKKSGDPEFIKLWQENETIKNRHGGFPPPKEESITRKQDKASVIDESRPMYLMANRVLDDNKALGLKTDSEFPIHQLKATLSTKIPPVEMELLNKAGLQEYLDSNKKLTPAALSKWIKENGPRVEVKKFGEVSQSPELIKGRDLVHKAETNGGDIETFQSEKHGRTLSLNFGGTEYLITSDGKIHLYGEGVRTKILDKGVDPLLDDIADNFESVYGALAGYDSGESAHWSQIAPKSESDMPGYVEIAVTIPPKVFERKDSQGKVTHYDGREPNQFPSSHNFPPNTLVFSRGYMETLPNGKKVFHVLEVQSDWGQSVREGKAKNINNLAKRDNPLLKDYNRLGLKAAIEHAKKEGADSIVISDAETAMMTEGHDMATQRVTEGNISDMAEIAKKADKSKGYILARNIEGNLIIKGMGETLMSETAPDSGKVIIYDKAPFLDYDHSKAINALNKQYKFEGIPDQAAGMRLNYDKILPSIAEELTGSKGERVSMGEHKNAFDRRVIEDRPYNPQEEGGNDRYKNVPRDNLIFKNPDGTPKTDVSGMSFPIDKTPEQFSLTAKRFQKQAEVLPEEPNTPKGPFKLFSTDLDIMRSKGGDFVKGADALDETLNVARQKSATYEGYLVDALEKLSGKERKELYAHLQAERSNEKVSPITSGPLAAAYKQYKDGLASMHEDQRSANMPVKQKDGSYRLPESHDYYTPNVPSHKVMEIVTKERTGAEYDSLKKDFLKHYENKGYTPEEAVKAFEEIQAQYGGSQLKTNYGAVRREEGAGLPSSWIEPDFLLATKRYINRFAKDRAWFDTIESDEELNKLFGGKATPWGDAYEDVGGNLLSDSVTKRAASQVAGFQDYGRKVKYVEPVSRPLTAAMLGPLTGIGDIVSTMGGMLKYVKPHQVPEVVASYRKAVDGYKSAMKTGLSRRDATSMYEVGILSSSFEDNMSKLSDVIYKYSGREKLEQISRGFGQAAGETIATIKLAEASSGDKKAISFLKMLANNRDYEKLSIQELGTRIAQRQQGTYDVRSLPYWAIDSSIAPFLKLARWNIGQTNEFAKTVVNKAIAGDIAPLINTLFGSIAAGYVIKELRERVSNKSDPIPSLKEIMAGGKENKLDLLAWNVAGATAYAGMGGMLGDMVKSALDVMHDNKPQGFTFPTIDAATDLASRSYHAAEAIKNGEDIVDVALAFNKDMAKQHIQVLRLVLNNLDKAGVENSHTRDFRRTEYRNDLRRFKQVEGEDVNPLGGSGLFEENPYEGLKTKEFKRTEDIGEAASMIPTLISNAVEKSKGDPYKLKQELRKLKANSYQTMPSPEQMPLSFASYIQYISKTQGVEEASKRLSDYFLQNAKNKAKSSMVP